MEGLVRICVAVLEVQQCTAAWHALSINRNNVEVPLTPATELGIHHAGVGRPSRNGNRRKNCADQRHLLCYIIQGQS